MANPPIITGSTAKIMVELNKWLLLMADQMDLPDSHPVIMAIKQFTIINAKTAQLTDEFNALPDVRSMRDQIESGLGKLGAIPTQAAKASSVLFTSQFSAPSENVKVSLNNLDAIQTAYRSLITNEHQSIVQILERINTASDPVSMLSSDDIKHEFASQDTERNKISHDVVALDKNLQGLVYQLDSLFTQIRNSLPVADRKTLGPSVAVAPESGPRPEDG